MSAEKLELSLLGGLRIEAAGVALQIPTRKAKALLCHLALPPDHPHPRAQLCGLLWGERTEARARNSLRQALFSLRKALPEGLSDVLCTRADEVRLEASLVATDVAALEAAAAQPIELVADRLGDMREGELLAGFGVDEEGFEAWLRPERERLRMLQVEQLTRLARHREQRGQATEAAATWTRVLRLEPWGERHHRALMEVYGRMGRRGALLRQYQQCVAALRRELDLEPSPATRTLYERWAAPAPHGLGQGAAAAPAQAHPLIGRSLPLTRLRKRWTEAIHGRGGVVLIAGDAGVGKSALARALRAELPDAHALMGRAFESEQVLSLAMWAEAIRGDAQVFGEPLWSSLPATAQRAALTLVPTSASAQPASRATGPSRETGSGPGPEGERLRRLFDGFEALLRCLSARAPLLVVCSTTSNGPTS